MHGWTTNRSNTSVLHGSMSIKVMVTELKNLCHNVEEYIKLPGEDNKHKLQHARSILSKSRN
uniref:Uncharacterized protein n=1 Tax=Rhizophora mucronata TaxID=61149 RepID=A0A2P2IQG9_RHIMU